MNMVFEIILELILEGAIGTMREKRVAMPIRIVAGIVAFGFFGGMIFLFVFAGLGCVKNSQIFCGILMFVTAGLMFIGIVINVVQYLRTRNL